MSAFHPACCSPFDSQWPLPQALPGARLVACLFQPDMLMAEDFLRCGIEAPASIQRSVAKRQAEFLAGRLCAREAMRGLGGPAVVPALGEDRAPQWPTGFSGSITHGKGWAAAVVAQQSDWRGLGLDVEQLLTETRAERLAGEILTPAELQRLRPGQTALQVTLTFSLKESLFKALYPLVGKRFYFEDAELLDWQPDGTARLRLLCDLSDDWCRGVELEAQFATFDEYLLSLVAVSARPGL
ncbi:4'-phosphopantetheinyl transferase family protein [Pseudomonas indica]|uniref:4'-phosphopantetheinyl transferase family protein n=1 Tax=Pseudomonas indica TaxID=137658 RepID=UPI000BABB2AB|nr:4'-phosphopantetheinyl transferase [Pseudomonas indica]PAU60166.1 4'-phosphopantetheinyl transferase [Pseudomonas indica]